MKFIKILILFVFLIVSSHQIKAQIGFSENVLSLDQCIRLALNNNPDIKLAEARLDPADAQLMSSIGDFLPSLGFNMNYRRTLFLEDTVFEQLGPIRVPLFVPNPNSYSMSLYANYTIFNGYAREAKYSVAENNVEVGKLNLRQAEKRITLNVYRQYIDVIKKSQILKARDENLTAGKKELERITAQYEAGVSPVATVYSQEAELGNRELELVTAENDLRKAKANLLATMGMYPDSDVDFKESSIPNLIEANQKRQFKLDLGNYKDALRLSLKNRLDHKALEININSAEENVSFANSSYYPQISASGGWSWNNSAFEKFQEGTSNVGLNLQIPIFNNFNRNASVQNAKLELNQREIEQIQSEQAIRAELQTAFLNIEASEKMLDITERSLKAASQNFEAAKERFHVGANSITDFTMANNQLITAQINRINAVYNYFQSQKEILYVIGKL